MAQYVAARREFVAACSEGVQRQHQQQVAAERSCLNNHMKQLYAKCEEAVSASHRHCDLQMKAWQEQRSQLLQSHSQSMQQLQVWVGFATVTSSKILARIHR
jgi:excinuclease UvrABC nuclease subunit